MTRARNIAGFSTITTTPSPVHVGPIGVLTATRIDGEFNVVDIVNRDITAQGIGVTNLQISGITTGLNVSGIITAQNGINFNGTSTGLNVSGVGTIATLNVTGNATIGGNANIGGVLTYEDVTNVDSVGVVTARGLSIFGNTTGLNATGVSTFNGDLNTNTINITDTIAHTGDLNTKIRFPAADTITAETAGSERLRITSAGKVGINSTSPTYALEVDGGTQNTVIVARSSDAKAAISFLDNTSGGYGRATVGGEGDEVYITSGAGVERLRITSAGLVGIGTAPESNANLHVMGSSRGRAIIHAGGTESAQLWLRNPKGTWKIHNYYDGDALTFTDDSSERMRISSAGNLGIGDDNPGVQLNVKGSGTSFAGQNTHVKIEDTTSLAANIGGLLAFEGVYDTSNNPAAFAMIHGGKESATNNNYAGYLRFFTRAHGSLPVERMRIRSNGNVVIDDSSGATLEMTRTSTNTSGMCGKLVFGNTDWDSSIASIQGYQDGDNDSGSLRFYTQASGASEAEQVRITKRGQVNLGGGLGASNSRNFTHLFDMHPICNPGGAFFNYNNGNVYLSQNLYFTGQWQLDQAAAGSYFHQSAGSFNFISAPSGSANAATSVYNLMQVTQSNLSTGLSRSGNRPSVKGNLVIFGESAASTAGGIEFHTSSGGGGGYGSRITANTDGTLQIHTRNNNAGWSTKLTVSGTNSVVSATQFGASDFVRSTGPGGGSGIKLQGLAAGSGSNAVDTGISVNRGNAGGTLLVIGSRNTGAGSATDSYVWLLRFNYDGNSAPQEFNIAGDSSFWSIGVSGSNTLTINGNSGNWMFGGIWVD